MKIITAVFPFAVSLKGYSRDKFRLDLSAGLTVALVLIPQSMALAQLAGVPVYYGLCAGFLPPVVAALFGSSRQLSTGPIAVVSLMTAVALEPLVTAGEDSYLAYIIILTLLVGVIQLTLGLLRLGLIVNFLSHPVINGFATAAALIIAFSQLAGLFGVTVDRATHQYETIYKVIVAALSDTHWPTLGMGVGALGIILLMRRYNPRAPGILIAVAITTLISWGTGFEQKRTGSLDDIASSAIRNRVLAYNAVLDTAEVKRAARADLRTQAIAVSDSIGENSEPAVILEAARGLLEVDLARLRAIAQVHRNSLRSQELRGLVDSTGRWRFHVAGPFPANSRDDGRSWRFRVGDATLDPASLTLHSGGAVIGEIPRGLPSFGFPQFTGPEVVRLLPLALIIAMLGFMQTISIAKAISAKTGQRVDANQELIGQGLANVTASFGQGFPVAGSFARSAVNLQTGAVTGLSNVIAGGIVGATLLFLTPLLYHLPESVLAAIIMISVIELIRVDAFMHAWRAQRYDGVIGVVTFVVTLVSAPHLEFGIIAGVGLTIGLHLLRLMKPRVVLLAKHPDGTFRDREASGLAQCRHIAVIRYEGSLIFSNVSFLEDQILRLRTEMPDLRHVVIVGDGINQLDVSGEDMLASLISRLRSARYDISLCGVKGPVLDVMQRTGLIGQLGEDHLYRTTDRAIAALWQSAHIETTEEFCPLINPVSDDRGIDSETG